MNDLYSPGVLEHATIYSQNVWHYEFQSTIGDLHIVQHEVKGEMNIVDDYIGWSRVKAEKAFQAISNKILKGKA